MKTKGFILLFELLIGIVFLLGMWASIHIPVAEMENTRVSLLCHDLASVSTYEGEIEEWTTIQGLSGRIRTEENDILDKESQRETCMNTRWENGALRVQRIFIEW